MSSDPGVFKGLGSAALTFASGLQTGLLLSMTVGLVSWKSPVEWPWWSFLIAGAALLSGVATARLVARLQTSFVWPIIGAVTGAVLPWAFLVAAFCGDGQCAGE